MPYKKIKSENYTEVGGINQKASLFKTGETEVLDLVNLDFSEPGAWTSRWGFTNSLVSGNTLTAGASQTITAIWQVIPSVPVPGTAPGLDTSPRTLFGHDSGIFKIKTTLSTSFIYENLLTGMTSCNWNFVDYREQSYFTTASGVTSFAAIPSQPPAFKYSPNVFGATYIDDTLAFFGMIQPPDGTLSASLISPSSATLTEFAAAGTYNFQYAYVDRFGFVGPRSATYTFSITVGANQINLFGMTTYNAASFGYQNATDPINATSAGNMAFFRDKVAGFPSTDMVYIGGLAFNPTGSTNISFHNAAGVVGGFPLASFSDPTPVVIASASESLAGKKFLEVYQNRLFAAGDDNKILFSEVDNLQLIYPENFILVGDSKFTISGIKSYNQGLMVFLRKGLERITGNSQDNFNKQTLTEEYGCISHKAVVEFNERLWFLDDDGVYEYTGASVKKVSSRMDDTFSYMNVNAAVQRACAIHFKERNEVWFSIPINGSTINNIVVVYDYDMNAWTTFKADKLKATAIAEMYTGFTLTPVTKVLNNKTYVFSSIGASLYNFSPSLLGDDGSGLTLSYRTRFHDAGGSKSSTSQFRRFFADAKISSGNTQIFGQTLSLSFYANYASNTISLTLPLALTTFTENRVEFGIPAKSLATEVAFGASTNMKVQFYGYTIESRYQRSV